MKAFQIKSFLFLPQQADDTAAHGGSLHVENAAYSSHCASDSTDAEESIPGIGRELTSDGSQNRAYPRRESTSRFMKIREMDLDLSLFHTTCKLSSEKVDELSSIAEYELSKLFDVHQECCEELCQLRRRISSNFKIIFMMLVVLDVLMKMMLGSVQLRLHTV